MKKSFLLIGLACLFSICNFSSCKDKETADNTPLPGQTIRFKTLLPKMNLFPVLEVQKISNNGKYIAASILAQSTASAMLLDVDAQSWSEVIVTQNGLKRQALVKAIANSGTVLLFSDNYYHLRKNGQTTKLDRYTQFDEYYLDENEHLLWLQNYNSSNGNSLLLKSNGASVWDTVTTAWKNFTFVSAKNGGGFVFISQSNNKTSTFDPSTKTFTEKTFDFDKTKVNINAGLNSKTVAFLGADGLIYIAGFSGFAKISNAGSANYVDYPSGFLYYENPLDFGADKNGVVYALLGQYSTPNTLFKFDKSKWEPMSTSSAVQFTSNGGFEISSTHFYYPGAAPGSLTFGIVAHDLSSGIKQVIGDKSLVANIQDAMLWVDGAKAIFLSDGLTYLYNPTSGLIEEVWNTLGATCLLRDKNGSIHVFGALHRYLFTTSGDFVEYKDYLSGLNPLGSPLISQQLGDGSFILITAQKEPYYNSSTGYTDMRYTHNIFKSTDAAVWQKVNDISKTTGPVTCIDLDGTLFRQLTLFNTLKNQIYYQNERSEDQGQTWKTIGSGAPNLAAPNKTLYITSGFKPKNGEIQKWNGTAWDKYNTSADLPLGTEYLGKAETSHLSFDGRVIVKTLDQAAFIAEKAF